MMSRIHLHICGYATSVIHRISFQKKPKGSFRHCGSFLPDPLFSLFSISPSFLLLALSFFLNSRISPSFLLSFSFMLFSELILEASLSLNFPSSSSRLVMDSLELEALFSFSVTVLFFDAFFFLKVKNSETTDLSSSLFSLLLSIAVIFFW